MSDLEDPVDLPDDGGDDLFGDAGDAGDAVNGGADVDGDVDAPSDDARALSDRDPASDQEAGEHDARDDMETEDQQNVRDKLIYEVQMFRHRTPRSKDGSLISLKMPKFIKFAAEEYKPDTFEPTQWDQDNVQKETPKMVVRYQKDPATGKMKSNAIVHRWSDGSTTISIGSEHYEVTKRQMAPPSDKPYRESHDSHLYAAAAHLSSNLLVTVGHVAEQYTVLPSKFMQDDATATFAAQMAVAARGKNKDNNIFTATRDPELQRKEAELAEKERMKAQRRRDNAAARASSGAGGYRSGGLSIGDLEGGRRAAGGARKRGQPGGSRPKKRRPEYDSDDDLPAGRGRNDEYDREDDFIAPSDDDNASDGVDDEEEDLLDDDEEEEAPRKKKPKAAEPDDDHADADADMDDDGPVESSRHRRRQIVDDEDDE